MPWTIANQQLDPMTFTLDTGVVTVAAGGGAAVVAVGVAKVNYHNLNYTRVGSWPFPDNQVLNASYPGGQNIVMQNPATFTTCIFSYTPALETSGVAREECIGDPR